MLLFARLLYMVLETEQACVSSFNCSLYFRSQLIKLLLYNTQIMILSVVTLVPRILIGALYRKMQEKMQVGDLCSYWCIILIIIDCMLFAFNRYLLWGCCSEASIMKLLLNCMNSVQLLWTKDLRMNTVHVVDVCRAIWHVCQHGRRGEIFNLADKSDSCKIICCFTLSVQIQSFSFL